MVNDSPGTETAQANSKIQRVTEKYGLDDVDEELTERWTRAENPESLRDLADQFNRWVLAAAVSNAGMNVLDGELDNLYRLLTDDVSRGVRTEATKRLERNGIDPDTLTSDFVSHQTVHNHLTKHLSVTQETVSDEERIEKGRQSVLRLQNRLRAITEELLDRLERTGRITLGSFTVFVNVNVFCEDCGVQLGVDDLLTAGGCDCADDE
ncbi:rod-determining factor RdfA [Haladaptatus sp. DYSN1]|nr:rod-determining factor RdfA [Haladaptatus sp. DYSN1]